MAPHWKWGLLAGGAAALLTLCGGTLIGVVNNCLVPVVSLAAGAVAGYLTGRSAQGEGAVKSGALAGVVAGALVLVGQLAGGLIGGVIGTGLLAGLDPSLRADAPTFLSGAGIGIGINLLVSLVVGVVMVAASAGVGALAAKMAAPKPAG